MPTHQFREDNTEGYSCTDLSILNDAFDALGCDFPDLEDKSLVDALNNAWVEDIEMYDLLNRAHALLTRPAR
jgi:hypothetical protein